MAEFIKTIFSGDEMFNVDETELFYILILILLILMALKLTGDNCSARMLSKENYRHSSSKYERHREKIKK